MSECFTDMCDSSMETLNSMPLMEQVSALGWFRLVYGVALLLALICVNIPIN